MSMNRVFAVALAAALAAPAVAQESGSIADRARRAAGGQAQPTTPAPAQPQAQPGQAGGQAQQGLPLTDEQRAAMAEVWSRNQVAIQLGDMAAQRGTSPQVKDLGRQLAEDHRREEKELSWLLQQRGTRTEQLAAGADRQRLDGGVAQLAGKSGEDFDRAFVEFLTQNNSAFVDALKRARDVTPGKDSAFKRWLDDSENTEEGHLTAARQLKTQQRQGRTPPAR